jgi:hypothetical protein
MAPRRRPVVAIAGRASCKICCIAAWPLTVQDQHIMAAEPTDTGGHDDPHAATAVLFIIVCFTVALGTKQFLAWVPIPTTGLLLVRCATPCVRGWHIDPCSAAAGSSC